MNRRQLLIGVAASALCATQAEAQMNDFGDYKDCRCRTPVDVATFKQPRTMVLVTSGQSMLGNYGLLTPYNPTSGEVYEFDIWSQKILKVTDGQFPTMSMNGGSGAWAGRTSVLPYWADQIVLSGKADRVLIVGHNVGGTTAQDWCPVGKCYGRSLGVLKMLQSMGIPPTIWVEMLGQADVDPANPTGAVSAQNWADLMVWKWEALINAGMKCPVILGQGAFWDGVSTVHTARYQMVRQGQQIAGAARPYVTLGPDDDVWPLSARVDGVHQRDTMRSGQGSAWAPFIPSL